MSRLVHQLTRADLDRITRHFLKLDAEDRRLRFGFALDDGGICAYCAQLDFDKGALFGVFGVFGALGRPDTGLELDGVAHLALWRGTGEVGLSVLASARGTGIGSLLFDRALLHARNSGVAELFMHSLRENAAIRHIAQRAAMRIVTDTNEADAFLELPPATALTLGQELYEQQCALIDWTLMHQVAVRTLAAPAAKTAKTARKTRTARPSSTLPRADSSRSRRVSP